MATESRDEGPYVGPRSFEREHIHLFFGRDRETSEALSLVIAHPVLLLYAASGAGKTSLLNAGLIPKLEEEGFDVLPLARLQGRIPVEIQPVEVRNPYVLNALIDWSPREADARDLLPLSLADLLRERERSADEFGFELLRVAIFDQFEELFTAYADRWECRAEFFEQVSKALAEDPLLRVILAIREDHIAQLDPYASLLPEKLRTRLRLERLRQTAAVEAVKGPLSGTERSYEDGAAERLVDELMEVRVRTLLRATDIVPGEFVEPVQLQVVCDRLWKNLPERTSVITMGHLHEFGDVNQALREFYELAIKAVIIFILAKRTGIRDFRAWLAAQITRVTIRVDIRTFFDRYLITPFDTRSTIVEGVERTGGLPNEAVKALVGQHIIRAEQRAGALWYELTHDRFIDPIKQSNAAWRADWLKRLLLAFVIVIALLGSGLLGAWAANPPRTCRGLTLRGDRLAADGEYEKANEKYLEAIALNDKCAIAHEHLADDYNREAKTIADAVKSYIQAGIIYRGLAQYRRALEAFDKAISLDDKSSRAYTLRGLVFLDRQEYEKAAADWKEATVRDSENASAHSYLGLVYCSEHKVEAARAEYEEAWRAYVKTEKFDDALKDYGLVTEKAPACASAWFYVGKARMEIAERDPAEFKLAVDACSKAIRLDDEMALAYFLRGLAYAAQGDLEEAIRDYTKALDRDSTLVDGYVQRGSAYAEQGELEKAEQDYDEALDRGSAYAEQGELEKAEQDYDEALDRESTLAEGYVQRARLYEKQNRFGEALADYDQALIHGQASAEVYLSRGLLYYKTGRAEQAIADLSRAADLEPGNAQAYLRLGQVYHELALKHSFQQRLQQPELDLAIANWQHAVVASQSDAPVVRLEAHLGLAGSILEKAVAYLSFGDRSTAEQFLDLSIAESTSGLDLKVEPDDRHLAPVYLVLAAAYHQKAHLHVRTGQLEAGEGLFQSALEAYEACSTHAGAVDSDLFERLEEFCTEGSDAVKEAQLTLGVGGVP